MYLLENKIRSLPKKPGVYLFRDLNGKIIYIGKALSLKHRVSSYFQDNQKDLKTKELVSKIADLQTIIVNSEFEALLLEAKLIKQHEPKYNTVQKDSKSYLYIVISKDFPNRIFTARWAELNQPLDSWYGPFPSSSDARQILKFIRRIFPFRSCKKLLKHPCLYKDLKLCPGVCIYPDENYLKTVQRIKLILFGKIKKLVSTLIKEMKIASKNQKYEEAQQVKDQIDSLTALTGGWRIVPKEKHDISKTMLGLRKLLVKHQGFDPITINKIEGYDVSNLGTDIIVGSMVAFVDGELEKGLYRKFNLKFNLINQNDPEGIRQILRRRLNHPEWIYSQLILIDGGKTQVSAAFQAVKEAGQAGRISLLGLTKEFESLVVPRIRNEKITGWQTLRLSRHSPELQFLQSVRDESHRFAQRYYTFLHSKKLRS